MIKLTGAINSKPIYVNPYSILTVRSVTYKNKQITQINMERDYFFIVKESVEEVLDMIGKASTFCV